MQTVDTDFEMSTVWKKSVRIASIFSLWGKVTIHHANPRHHGVAAGNPELEMTFLLSPEMGS